MIADHHSKKVVFSTIKNLSTGEELEAEHRRDFLGLVRGLSWRKKYNKALLLEFGREGRNGIWMLGMRFGIDLVFIDENKKVDSVYRDLKPMTLNPKTWKIYYPKRKAKYALEIVGTKIKEGDRLNF